MRFLVDTHVLLWLSDSATLHKVPGNVRDTLSDPQCDLLVSVVSLWEISLKSWLGKLPSGAPFLSRWATSAARFRATVVSIDAQHAIEAGRLDWDHTDPFDRMLAAQAIIEEATIVSIDRAFDSVVGLPRLWADHS